MSVPNHRLRELAQEYLRMAHANYRERNMQRIYFARLAREYGLSYQAIADAYEMTESGVRAMLQRAEDPHE